MLEFYKCHSDSIGRWGNPEREAQALVCLSVCLCLSSWSSTVPRSSLKPSSVPSTLGFLASLGLLAAVPAVETLPRHAGRARPRLCQTPRQFYCWLQQDRDVGCNRTNWIWTPASLTESPDLLSERPLSRYPSPSRCPTCPVHNSVRTMCKESFCNKVFWSTAVY